MSRSLPLAVALMCLPVAGGVSAQDVGGPPLGVETAEKMAAACVAYAKSHQGAVNIWVYDTAGGLVHFQRMDGAPATGPSVGGGITVPGGFGSLSAAADADGPGPGGPGSVPASRWRIHRSVILVAYASCSG